MPTKLRRSVGPCQPVFTVAEVAASVAVDD